MPSSISCLKIPANKMIQRGGWLLLLLMLGLTAYDLGRSFLHSEERPALAFSHARGPLILLTNSSRRLDGIHQINDGMQLVGAIKLADLELPPEVQKRLLGYAPFESGRSFEFHIVGQRVQSFAAGWMPAAMRISLGIPLQLKRMTSADWDDLPGVGASLARRIGSFRQLNGEFGSLRELHRVKGIGQKQIDQWRQYFYEL